METFLFYILRISIASGVLYAFYKLLLSRNILHNYNRLVILFFYLGSLVTAWITIDYSWIFLKKEAATLDFSQFNITTTVAPVQQTAEINWLKIISIVYIIGFVIFLSVFLVSFSKMIFIILKSKKNKLENNITLCISDADVSPFSWMNYLVISEDDYTNDNQAIIQHETAHIQYHHSWDMMLSNTYLLFTWFNPFAWLLRKELQTIHEYQADKKVISAGADAKEYQLLLIRKCVGEKKFMLANNFEYNHLQKRIKMIMKTNSVKQKRGIYALIPILLIVISTMLSAENLQSKIKLTKESFDLKKDSIKRELKVVNIGDTTFITETVNGVVTTSKMIGKQSIDSIKGRKMIIMNDEENDGKKITKKIIIFRDSTKSEVKPLYILDGKEISSDDMKNINPEEIATMDVLKDKSATAIYGEKGKNGVIIITSKNGKKTDTSDVTKKENIVSISVADVRSTPNKTTYIVDGVYTDKKVADNISPDNIATVNVYKGDQAVKMYGEKGKNGVVIITTKKDKNGEPFYLKLNNTKMKIRKSTNTLDKALIIVDGVRTDNEDVNNINPSNIVNIDVLKGDEAIKRYGQKGKNGVVNITTKRYSYNAGDNPVKEDVMNYIDKQKNKKLSSAKISNEGNKVTTKGISDKNTAVFIDGQLADVKTLQKMDNSKIKVINIDPISNFPELAIKYNLHKERIVQVFTK